jgi:hypothetical protein
MTETFGYHELFHALALAGQLVLLVAVWLLLPDRPGAP